MPALYSKGRRFEPHRRRFFTPTVVLLSFNKPETVLWTIAKYKYSLVNMYVLEKNDSQKSYLTRFIIMHEQQMNSISPVSSG